MSHRIKINFTRTWIISAKGKPDDYCEKLLNSLEDNLKKYDFETHRNLTIIEYRKVLRRTTNYGANMKEAMKFLRNGKIRVESKSNKTIHIRSYTDLSQLIFATIGLGIVMILAGWFYGHNLKLLGILTVILLLILFLFALGGIGSRIGVIIEKALAKT